MQCKNISAAQNNSGASDRWSSENERNDASAEGSTRVNQNASAFCKPLLPRRCE